MQSLHIPLGMVQWRDVCSYRGDQTLVQGRLKVRTGEKRGRLREGLREWVSEEWVS